MLRFVVALPCEARPLVRRYRLRSIESRPFRLFADGDTALVVSGVGGIAAAAAAGYLHARTGAQRDALWINAGVAGHRDRAIGDLIVAHSIRALDSARTAYPVFIGAPPIASAPLITVSRPERDYREDALYDMEGAAFQDAASRFASAELVHCVKVVSDNAQHPAQTIDAAWVEGLVDAAVEGIAGFVARLMPLAAELRGLESEPEAFAELSPRIRLSFTESHRVRSLLRRLEVCGSPAELAVLDAIERPRDLIAHLEARLASVPPPSFPAPRS